MIRLTNTAILLIYTSRFHWKFSGNWQEHICERNIRCFVSPSHLSLGSDRLNVTVCQTCTVPLWDLQWTVGSWSYWKNILGWLALRSSNSPHLYSTIVFGIYFWGEEGRMTVENIGKWQRVCSQHFVDGRLTPQHPHRTLFDYNNIKVSKSRRTPTTRTHTGKGSIKTPVNTTMVD